MFKDQIKKLRLENDFTQEDLATKLNITRQSISKWENGLSYPTNHMIHQLIEVFHVTFKDLLDPDELALISIDNNTKINHVKRRTMFILSAILIVLVGSIIGIVLLNGRINQIELTAFDDNIIPDPLLGYILLDSNALDLYDDTNVQSLYTLLDSNDYPYAYYNIREQIPFWEDNKLYHATTTISTTETTIDGTIYFLTQDIPIVYYLMMILYDQEKEEMYLGSGSGFYKQNIATTITRHFEGENNDLVGPVEFNITYKFVDELSSVTISQYDETYQLIQTDTITNNDPMSLDEDTLYVVITETYINTDDDIYLNKIVVNYDDFNYYYVYMRQVSNNSYFPEYEAVVIDTFIS